MSGVTNEETGSRECMFEVNYKPTDRSPMQSWKSAHPSHMSYVSVSSQSLLKWAPTSHIRWHRTLKNHSVVVVLPLIHRWLTKSSARGQQNQHFHHCQACWRLLDNLLLIISSVATVLQWLFWHHSTYIAANHRGLWMSLNLKHQGGCTPFNTCKPRWGAPLREPPLYV